jgi:hypothetical protein
MLKRPTHKVPDIEKEQKVEDEQKQPRMYASAVDIAAYFDRKPDCLYAYVATGHAKNVSILFGHLLQLAEKAGPKLRVPEGDVTGGCAAQFVNPRNFSNIAQILDKAYGVKDAFTHKLTKMGA